MERRSTIVNLDSCSYLVSISSEGFQEDMADGDFLIAAAKILLDSGVVLRARVILPAFLHGRLRDMRMTGAPRAAVNPVSGAKRIALWDFEGRMRAGNDGMPVLVVSAINGLDRVETKDGLLNLLESVDPV